MTKKSRAFSLIELSIVILIIGILIAGVTQASRLVRESKLKTAQTLTKSSPVSGISGLVLWLEPSLDESFVTQSGTNQTEDGTTISQWNDINPQSSPKYFATVSGTAPTYSANSGPNGLPSIYFASGAVLTLSNDAAGGNYTSITTPNNQFTFFVTYQLKPVSLTYNFNFGVSDAFATPPSSATLGTISISSKGTWQYNISADIRTLSGSGITGSSTASTASSSVEIISTTFDGSSFNLFLNGNSKTSGALTSNTTPTNFNITGSDSYISEIIVFDRALKNQERRDIEDYLGEKYNVAVRGVE